MTLNQKLSENLEKLEQSLADVLQAADSLEGRKPWKSSLIGAVRKLRVMRELNQRYYIAITGTQGAGKTRLIRSLYELDTTWLEDNLGRGEKVPVFIIEKDDVVAPQGAVLRVNDSGGIEEKRIEADDFRKITTSWGDKGEDLFPLLYVPRRYFHGVAAGFVLLPGFERNGTQNRVWQLLMEYVLEHASGSVIVTDQTRLADDSQDRVREVASNDKVPGHKPVIAISKTENIDEPTREMLCRRAAVRFEVGPAESERIVCIGTGGHAWVNEFMSAVEKYVLLGLDLTNARLDALDEVVDDEICDIHDEIGERLREDGLGTDPGEDHRERLLGVFRKARDEYRGRYERELVQYTRSYAGKAKKKARDRYGKEEEGFTNGLTNIGRWFSTTSGTREDIHVGRIQDCWANPEDKPNGIALIESDWKVLSSQSARYLKLPFDDSKVVKADDLDALLGYDELGNQSKLAALLDQPGMINELRKLLSLDLGEMQTAKPLENEHFGDVLKLVPALTMEYLRINQSLLLTHQDRLPGAPEAQSMGKIMSELADDMKVVNDTAKTLLRTIGAILAVDVAIDGTVDTVPGLLHAIFGGATSGGASAAATLGGTLSMAAAGAIVVGVIGYKVTQHMQQLDAAHRGYINMVIDQIAEAHVQRCLCVYDDAMDLIADRIHGTLGHAYHLDKKDSTTDNLLRALARLRRAQLSVLGDLRAKQLLV